MPLYGADGLYVVKLVAPRGRKRVTPGRYEHEDRTPPPLSLAFGLLLVTHVTLVARVDRVWRACLSDVVDQAYTTNGMDNRWTILAADEAKRFRQMLGTTR